MQVRTPNRHSKDILNIPAKANRILNVILVGMLLIIFRIWHLSVLQYQEKLEESRKPQRRTVTEAAKRATIRDRFNFPLAINKIQYNAAIHYNLIKQIPTSVWELDESGKKVRRPKRKTYITALANLLGKELDMPVDRIEDLIHAKASFFNQIPFVLKEDITEKQYYRLKMLEKDWPGIVVQHVPQRHYTLGKVAGDIIGYMGAINHQEYEGIIREIKALESYLEDHEAGDVATMPPGVDSPAQGRQRLKDLHELAYTVNDSIGKMGIEARFEKTLRGYRGKKSYYSDAQGNFLRELPGSRDPLSGKRLLLTISAELQQYAEQLLIENENIRQTRLSPLGPIKHTILADKIPWIKGGAIVAMDPHTGDILAMASHPRLEPNDFIHAGTSEERKIKNSNVNKWLENEAYLAEIWDQQRDLEREVFQDTQGIFTEKMELTWSNYLDLILAKDNPMRKGILFSGTVADAIHVQNAFDKTMEILPEVNAYVLLNHLYQGEHHKPHGKKVSQQQTDEMEKKIAASSADIKMLKRQLDPYLSPCESCYDKVLTLDLLRLAVPAERFSPRLIKATGQQNLAQYKKASAAMVQVHDIAKKMAKNLYHDLDFKDWRKAHEKEYLKKIRDEEKRTHKYAKPYIDYIDSLENEMFQSFWNQHRWQFLIAFLTDSSSYNAADKELLKPYFENYHDWYQEILQGAHQEIEWSKAYFTLKQGIQGLPVDISIEYLQTLRSYQNLERPLLGKYRYLRKNSDNIQQEKHLAAAFYPKFGFGYGRSQAYRQAATQGSIFKLITAYEALVQRYQTLQSEGKPTTDLNPFEMVDSPFYKGKELFLGYTASGQPIPRHYKGGRLPKSAIANIGNLDILKALEMSSNPYFALLAGDILKSPLDLIHAAQKFSFGKRTGIDLPGEIPGKVPDDLEHNRTGLYSLAIGQHSLVVTPIQTSVMMSALANGGKVLKPKLIHMMVGKEPQRGCELVTKNQYFPYQDSLQLVDIDFPLFIATDAAHQKSLIKAVPTHVQHEIFLPDAVRRILLDGMCRVVARTHNESLMSLSKLYKNQPEAISDYIELKSQLLGKTSTAESIENMDLDLDKGTNIYTHVWFGGIVYEQDVLDKKENRFVFRNSFGTPELVVVVYLRYGGYGKEAGPIAAQIAHKWREIKHRHANP